MEEAEAEEEANKNRKYSLRVAWFNCAGGLLAKIDNVKLILSLHDYDVLFVSESEIKQNIDCSLFTISGYSFHVAGTLESRGHARSSVFVKEGLE